jgi:hypothetical protein
MNVGEVRPTALTPKTRQINMEFAIIGLHCKLSHKLHAYIYLLETVFCMNVNDF